MAGDYFLPAEGSMVESNNQLKRIVKARAAILRDGTDTPLVRYFSLPDVQAPEMVSLIVEKDKYYVVYCTALLTIKPSLNGPVWSEDPNYGKESSIVVNKVEIEKELATRIASICCTVIRKAHYPEVNEKIYSSKLAYLEADIPNFGMMSVEFPYPGSQNSLPDLVGQVLVALRDYPMTVNESERKPVRDRLLRKIIDTEAKLKQIEESERKVAPPISDPAKAV